MGDTGNEPFSAAASRLESEAKQFSRRRRGGGGAILPFDAGLPEDRAPKPNLAPGAQSKAAREDNDFFPTPWEGSEAFMRAEGGMIARCFQTVWEPACGRGDMAEVIKQHGIRVIATDLIDRGYGEGGRNFLLEKRPLARAIVSNPPFADLPNKFVRHAKSLGVLYIALLLKADWWNADERFRLWNDLPPAREYPLSFRLDFLDIGRPEYNCTWYVWDWRNDHPGYCKKYRPLPKPMGKGMTDMFRGKP